MTLITVEEAEHEFAESVAYYESKEAGLGLRFRDEVASGRLDPAIPRDAPTQSPRLSSNKSARFSSLCRLRYTRRHNLDYSDCAWPSASGVLDGQDLIPTI